MLFIVYAIQPDLKHEVVEDEEKQKQILTIIRFSLILLCLGVVAQVLFVIYQVTTALGGVIVAIGNKLKMNNQRIKEFNNL